MKTRHPEIPALVLSMHDEALYAERALRAGARGYVTKQQLDDTVLVAIRRLLDGEMYMSDKLEARLAAKYVGGVTLETDSPLHALSDRELEVFRLIGQGRCTRQIADTLHLSIKTIESHLRAHQAEADARVRCGAGPPRHPMGRRRPDKLTASADRAGPAVPSGHVNRSPLAAALPASLSPHRGFPHAINRAWTRCARGASTVLSCLVRTARE